MKKLYILFFTIASVFLLVSCSGWKDPVDPIIPENTPTPEDSTAGDDHIADSVIVEDDTAPPEEGMVRSRLTNEWIDEEIASLRPIAVMTANEKAAVPHYNLSEASVLYEATVEGKMTRLLAIYEDWTALEKIGNVRSLRTYFGYWGFEWDAFLVHMGGPYYIDDLLAQPDTQNVNGIYYADENAFFRSSDRKEPHNAYTFGEGILEVLAEKDYSLTYRELTEKNHFRFTSKADPNALTQYGDKAESATYIDMSGAYPLTRCYFEYNEEDGLYYRSQHLSGGIDGPHVDAATGDQLSFKNVIVQYTYHEVLADGYLVYQCHDTTRGGWYFTNGRAIPITWQKTSDYGATRYYDMNGNEITMNTGKTMICIVEDGDTVSFH